MNHPETRRWEKDLLFLLFCMIVSFPVRGAIRQCNENDICSAIRFNTNVIGDMAYDIKDIENISSLIKSSNEDMRSVLVELKEIVASEGFATEVEQLSINLTECRNHSNLAAGQIIAVTHEMSSFEVDDEWEDKMSRLRQEKEALLLMNADLEETKHPFHETNTRHKQTIWELTMVFYLPLDCADIQQMGNTENGVYTIYPTQSKESPLEVMCDLESNGGGWTVFFTRGPHPSPPVDFNESWLNFKKGFGTLATEYWLGNDLLHLLTFNETSTLRFDAEDYTEDKRWAEWGVFKIDSEDNKYQLTLGDYQNNSTMGDSFSHLNNSLFTTFDQDNDESEDYNCAEKASPSLYWGKGAWWYKQCSFMRPTAPLRNTNFWNSACYGYWDKGGIRLVSMKSLAMKFRRLNHDEKLALSDAAVPMHTV